MNSLIQSLGLIKRAGHDMIRFLPLNISFNLSCPEVHITWHNQILFQFKVTHGCIMLLKTRLGIDYDASRLFMSLM